jgi:hypothetical protein
MVRTFYRLGWVGVVGGLLAGTAAWSDEDWLPEALTLGGLLALDQKINAEVRRHQTEEGLEIARWISRVGHPLLVGAGAAWAASRSREPARKRKWTQVAQAVATAGAVAETLKLLVGRPRPVDWRNGDHSLGPKLDFDLSFPSGHAAGVFAAATVLGREDPRHRDGYLVGAILVGLSRLYLDRHYASDVWAGALVGIASGKYVQRHGRGLVEIKF